MGRLFLVSWFAACINSNSVTCADGTVCPSGNTCDLVHHLCVVDDQITSCDGKQPNEACSGVMDGHCTDGVCLPSACGDAIVEFGEACDDGNTADLGSDAKPDGCSADCHSAFTCGNGITDVVMGEQCDDGNHVDHDGCSSTCFVESPHWVHHTLAMPTITDMAYAYDSDRDRLVIFGGAPLPAVPNVLDATYELDGADWVVADPPLSPSPRLNMSMAFDAARHTTILFGGVIGSGGQPLSDTWTWDGQRWRQLSVVGPSPRMGASMAYDQKRKVVVLFGGIDPIAKVNLGDTWEWDGAQWKMTIDGTAATTHPSARPYAAVAFDPRVGKLVLVGGGTDQGTPIKDTWSYDGAWTNISPQTGTAPQVTRAGLVYDPPNQRFVLVGGYTGANAVTAQMWSFNGSTWTSLGNTSFSARGASAVARVAGKLTVFGGDNGTITAYSDTFIQTGATWGTPVSPGARRPAFAVNDYETGIATMWGGIASNGSYLADTFDISTSGFAQRATPTQPSGRYYVYRGWDPARHQLVMYGGANTNALSDTWTFDRNGWHVQAPATIPSARRAGVMAFDGTDMIMFGGLDNATNEINETWKWDGTNWTKLTPMASPSPREFGIAAYDPVSNKLVMFGGLDSQGSFDETWTFDGTNWTNVSSGFRPNRDIGTLTFNPVRGRLTMISGGISLTAYEWDGRQWSTIPAPANPPGRGSHATFVTPRGTGLYSYGGYVIQDPGDPQSSIISDDRVELRWDGPSGGDERCDGTDIDGDGLVGCADPDCWYVCQPLCPPSMSCMAVPPPTCGDGICDGPRESCRTCQADCGECAAICGDGVCQTGETCPGDCP